MPSRKRIRIQFFGRCLLGLAGVAGAVAIPARAATLRPVSTLLQCDAQGNLLFQPVGSSCELINPGGPGIPGVTISNSRASAHFTLSPDPTLTAFAFSGDGFLGSSAQASVGYYFQVTGGNPGDVVPLQIATTLTTACSSPDIARCQATASFFVLTTVFGFDGVKACTGGLCAESSFFGPWNTLAASGEAGNFISLGVTASAVALCSTPLSCTSESANAFADPVISIDP